MASSPSKKRGKSISLVPLYALLVVLFVAYLLGQHVQLLSTILGIALLLTIIAVIALEVINGFKEQGVSRNLLELAVVIVIVVAIWFGLRFFLHTPYPIDVVPSCSMLPHLQRGDMLLLQGINGINGVKAPVVGITSANLSKVFQNPTQEALACVAYKPNGNSAQASQYLLPGYQIGLIEATQSGGLIVDNATQQNNPIKYICGVSDQKLSNGSTVKIVTTNAIIIGNTTIRGDANNTVVVYSTVPSDLFYREGDSYIVHRIYAVLNASGSYYFLTKGDNNPGLDIQYSNYPSNSSQIQGKVIASVPYVGYLKLILSNQFSEPAGCNSTIVN